MQDQLVYCSNFVYYRDGAFSDELCDSLMHRFDNDIEIAEKDLDLGYKQFGGYKLARDDRQIVLPERLPDCYSDIIGIIMGELPLYAEQVPSVQNQVLISQHAKMQKTTPTGGYHVWHHEQANGVMANRALAWMVYLNDVQSGGETEFLFQSMRVEPKKGRMVIWPAGVTHPHRGNPPLSGSKYIVTGWYAYPSKEYLELFKLCNYGGANAG